MSRMKKKYSNGQSRGGVPGVTVDSANANKKDYHRQALAFHGSESAYEKYVDEGRRGYYKSK